MKKLGKIKDLLSRNEMKQVHGGSLGPASSFCECRGEYGGTYEYEVENCWICETLWQCSGLPCVVR